MFFRNFKILLFVFWIGAFSVIFAQNDISQPVAKQGILDLRNYSWNKPLKLEGEWEFYWNKILTPLDFKEKKYTPDAYINVPSSWTSLNLPGIKDTGVATYRLVILVNPDEINKYSLLFYEELSAYQVWWNGKKIIKVGKVANCSCTYEARDYPVFTTVSLDKDKIELIINIADFKHRDAGLIRSPYMGKEADIQHLFFSNAFIDVFMLGTLLIMALYHIGLFVFRRKNINALAFALFLLIVSLRVPFSSNLIACYLFPNLSWDLIYRIGYFTFYAMVPMFIYFIKTAFDIKKYKFAFYFIWGFSVLYLLTLFLPSIIYTKLLIGYQIFTLFAVIFVLFLLIKSILARQPGARIMTFIFLLFIISGFHDIFISLGIVKSSQEWVSIGSFLLILGQSLTLARIFTKAFEQNEKLTVELNYQKENLEVLVKQRTREIEQKNAELIAQNEEIIRQREEIEKQKEALEFHNQIITESITYASIIQKAVLPVQENLKKYFDYFILYLPRDIVSGDFYWFNDNQEKYFYFALADCTGHGVSAAFLSIIGIYLLHSEIIEKKSDDPKLIIKNLNTVFKSFFKRHNNQQKYVDGMDIIILRFDKNNPLHFVYAAANQDLVIYKEAEKTVYRYRGDRFSVGMSSDDTNIENKEMFITENDIIYLFSDGFKDQNNKDGKRYGTSRFLNLIKQVAELPMHIQKKQFLEEFENYKADQMQRDDVTVIALRNIKK